MPEPEYSWLVDMATTCGLYAETGFGRIAVKWQEIHAWQQATHNGGIWIAEAVHELSQRYISEFYDATDAHRPCPIDLDESERKRAAGKQVKDFFQRHRNG
jgi:hypothetical protein